MNFSYKALDYGLCCQVKFAYIFHLRTQMNVAFSQFMLMT